MDHMTLLSLMDRRDINTAGVCQRLIATVSLPALCNDQGAAGKSKEKGTSD